MERRLKSLLGNVDHSGHLHIAQKFTAIHSQSHIYLDLGSLSENKLDNYNINGILTYRLSCFPLQQQL